MKTHLHIHENLKSHVQDQLCANNFFHSWGNNSVSKQEQKDKTPVLTLARAAATHVVCQVLESASNVDFKFKLHFGHAYAPKYFWGLLKRVFEYFNLDLKGNTSIHSNLIFDSSLQEGEYVM